jgi:glycosyltransferase involved in cell wall biosynthesis
MSKRLHFLHIFPNFGPGGMELRVTRIINGIGPEVRHTIVALLGNHDARHFIDSGIQTNFPIPPPKGAVVPYVWAMRGILSKVQPDLLLTYNWGSIDALLGAWSARFRPIVHHECGFGSDEAMGLKPGRVLARQILLRQAFSVAVTSRTLRDISVKQFKLPADRVSWIRTGIDVERFRPGLSRGWRARVGIREDELLFGFVGVLRAEKNLPLLLRAFVEARIPNTKVVLVGDGPDRPVLEQSVRDQGLADRVIFTGRVPDPLTVLAALDVFVLSSCTEQTSNALLEAMACGLPAIATGVGDSSEMLGHPGPPMIVPSGDVQAYSEALRALALSPDLRRRLGTKNRKRCLEQYRLERMVHEYESLYQAAYRSAL